MEIYTVQNGDTYTSIAKKFGVSLKWMVRENGLDINQKLVVGQTIVIQYPEQIHVIERGDTLEKISRIYGISVLALLQNNRWLSYPYVLIPEDILVILYKGEKIGDLEVGGYGYQFIEEELLRDISPYLTYYLSFTYGYTVEGDLISIKDEALIEISHEYQTEVLMVFSNMDEEGEFSPDQAHVLLANETLQQEVVEKLLVEVEKKGYVGIDVDFEYVKEEDRNLYTKFLDYLTQIFNKAGYMVSVALAPKPSDLPGPLYEAHDYEAIGAIVNQVFLMTYEWGYSAGPPMAVAPLDKIKEVLEYAVSLIPKEKILMGLPNYGYDWSLPYISGKSPKAQVLSNTQAVDRASFYKAEILFDIPFASPYYYYTDNNDVEHVVWFENAKSIEEKLNLVEEYGIRGVRYWNVMKDFPQNWLVINGLYDIIKVRS